MALNEHAEKNTQAESHRKPPQSVQHFADDLYRRSAILHWLSRADDEPNSKKRKAILDYVLELTRPLRDKAAGFAWQPVLAFAGALAVCIALWMASRERQTFFYAHPHSYLRVIQNLDACLGDGSCGFRFVMQAVTDGTPGPETEMHFCRGMQPRFEQGHTLAWIRYTNLGSCQAIDGYDVLRGSDRLPLLAANCRPDYSVAREFGHIACEGGKARF